MAHEQIGRGLVEVAQLGAGPLPHLVVLVIVRVGQHFQQVFVPVRAAAVFRRAGALPEDASDLVGAGAEDLDVVFPAVAEVVEIREGRRQVFQVMLGLVLLLHPVVVIGRNPVGGLVRSDELVQVAVGPADGDLEEVVQFRQGAVRRDVDHPCHDRLHLAKGDPQTSSPHPARLGHRLLASPMVRVWGLTVTCPGRRQNVGMDICRDVSVAVVAPPGTGPVLRAGAVAMVEWAMVELDFDLKYYQLDSEGDNPGVVMRAVDLDGMSEQELQARVAAAVQDLLKANPELSGWGHRVDVAATADDEDEHDEDLDQEAAALVPDGERLASDLMHAIDYEQSIYESGRAFRALPLEDLAMGDVESLPESERTEAVRQATALAGCLMHAAVVVVDQLFEDIEHLRTAEGPEDFDIDASWQLSQLPSRFAHRYTPLFAQEFLVTLVDVTARFTVGWEPLACVAQELGLRLLLNHVEVVADTSDVLLQDGWREHLEEMLFEDVDHELLYDMSFDGIEDDVSAQPPGMAPMRFEDWFAPFNSERSLPPYALPSRGGNSAEQEDS
jgi:hypothetical protein